MIGGTKRRVGSGWREGGSIVSLFAFAYLYVHVTSLMLALGLDGLQYSIGHVADEDHKKAN